MRHRFFATGTLAARTLALLGITFVGASAAVASGPTAHRLGRHGHVRSHAPHAQPHIGAAAHHAQPNRSRASRAPHAAHAAPAPTLSYFPGGNPHVPLAIADGNLLRSAVADAERGHTCGPRVRWRSSQSRWNAIDAWGQLVGSYTVDGFDDYDVTGCAEIAFNGAPNNEGALVYVSADSPWTPSPPVRWTPSPAQARSFEAALGDVVRGHAQTGLMRECREVPDAPRFFEIKAGTGADAAPPQRFAVGGRNGGYLVAALAADGSWTRVLAQAEPVRAPDFTLCYRPVAVFDMNGDGVPEIIMRESEPASWGDFVLRRSLTGHWQVTARSPGGSTA